MKFLFLTLVLAASANLYARSDRQPKLATCSSSELNLSFEFDHAFLPTPQNIKISVLGSKTVFIAEGYSSSYKPDDFMHATQAELSVFGKIFKTRKFRNQALDGSFSISVDSVFSDVTAFGKVSFSSKSAALDIKAQDLSCSIKAL